ncbi:MAG: hypothetical protein ACC667_04115 [Longimicrobiales bacterium]
MFEGLFEFLFKYRLLVFQEGGFSFTSPWPWAIGLMVAAALAVPSALTYTAARGDSTAGDRGIMGGLRLGTLSILVFVLLQPTLIITSVVPQRNFVGILIDDSRSMSIADQDGRPRSEFVARNFTGGESELLKQLAERFTLRFFRFSSGTQRLGDLSELGYRGSRSEIGPALVRAQEELAGVPLSGLIMITDGADNSREPLSEALLPLQAASTPVYTIGLGEEILSPDIQVSRVEIPRSVLAGASLVVDVIISQRGFRGRTVPLVVEDAGRIVASQDVELKGDGEPVLARVRFEASEAGPRLLRFGIPLQPDERVGRNNTREVLLNVRDEREKILYFEGEPRWEVKYLRRAVADDENLQVVILQRTAENKFLRLNVDTPEELAAGFPRTREELFRYQGLVLGSVEASFFTHDQLNMIADFVSERGGGLLMLGGRNAFREGGYEGTPIAQVMPVFMDDELSDGSGPYFAELDVRPTRSGLTHPAIQLGQKEEALEEAWETLPPVTSLNPISKLKPGATALLEAASGSRSARQIVLAYHRFGRGKAIVLPIQDSWIWQMHADVSVDDQRHETFWRQLLRWLVDGVPDGVIAETDRERVEVGESVEFRATVSDSAFMDVNNGFVSAFIEGPSGQPVERRMEWTVDEDGVYDAAFVPTEPGLYEIRVEATRDADSLGTGSTFVYVKESDEEYFDSGMRRTTLERVADETGGRFYTPETVSNLPEDISLTGAGVTLTEERDLWDMPFLLLLLLSLLGGEWMYRRARGLI